MIQHLLTNWLIPKFYKYLFLVLFLGSIFLLVVIITYYKGNKSHSVTINDVHDAWYKPSKKKNKILKKHETRCRQILEQVLQTSFPSIRPDFLKYSTGKNLELDGYSEPLQLAFEYQGIQHRKYCPGMFHASYEDFLKQQTRDAFKKRRCEEEGIHVIYIPDTIPYDKLGDFLYEEIQQWRNKNE